MRDRPAGPRRRGREWCPGTTEFVQSDPAGLSPPPYGGRGAAPDDLTPRDLRRAGTFVHPDDFRDAVPGPTMACCVLIARRSAGGRNQLQAVAPTRFCQKRAPRGTRRVKLQLGRRWADGEVGADLTGFRDRDEPPGGALVTGAILRELQTVRVDQRYGGPVYGYPLIGIDARPSPPSRGASSI